MKKSLFLIGLYCLSCLAFAQNSAPVGVTDSVEVMDQMEALFDVKANDYDPDGDEFWLYDVINSTHQVSIQDEKILFRSKPYNGYVLVRYRLFDNNAVSERTYLFVHVLPNPHVPVAVPDTFQLMQLASQQLDVLGNDLDPDNDIIKINNVSNELNCVVTISDDSLSVTVKPLLGSYFRFKYDVVESNTPDHYLSFKQIVDGEVIVNPDIPVINPDNATATGGIEKVIDVLQNDIDTQGDAFEIYGFTHPQHGTLELSDNKFHYTPELSFAGEDIFTYTVREVNDTTIYSDFAFVTVTVLKNPDCPVAVTDEAHGTTAVEMIIDVMSNDYDTNGDDFALLDVDGGTITGDNKILYKSSNLQLNNDTISYRIVETGNPLSYSEWTKVFITLAINPALPVARPDTVYAKGGIPVFVLPLENDIANNADTLILSPILTNSRHWGLATRANDTVHYLPVYQANGTDRINYYIKGNTNELLAMGYIVIISESKFYDSLQISNINAGVLGGSSLFTRLKELPGQGIFNENIDPYAHQGGHFMFPKDDKKSTIFTSTLWAGGMDDQNILHFAGEKYKQGPGTSGGIDYQPGPIANEYHTNYLLKYLRTWKVSRQEVEYHINNYWKTGYTTPEAILNWPGNGNTDNGEAAILAPYFDFNADGTYNSHDGDYPLIRGDQSIFLMFNDDRQHTETFGEQLNMEVHAMVYGFNNPDDTAVYNSIFVHYDIINRSNHTYSDFYTGIFTDTDLGFERDDYVGCNVEKGFFYSYNGKTIDGDGQYWAYGENPPTQSIAILAGPYKDDDGIDNAAEDCSESINGLNYGNGIADDERLGLSTFVYTNNYGAVGPYMLDPDYAPQYYNYMQSKWLDSTQMLYGGNGHTSTGAVGPACKYMFPGDSDPFNWGTNCIPPNGGYNTNGKFWTEEETGNNPEDRRGLGVSGPFTFAPGQTQEIELAFTVGTATAGMPGTAVNNLIDAISHIREEIGAGNIIVPNDQLGFNKKDIKPFELKAYPVPADNILTVETTDCFQSSHAEYIIYDLLGTVVMRGNITMQPRQSINISRLEDGFYVLKVQSRDAQGVCKFIKK